MPISVLDCHIPEMNAKKYGHDQCEPNLSNA